MQTYPALLELASQKLHPLGVSESFLVGRNETADVCVLDKGCSRHHFRLVRAQGKYHVESLKPDNPTYHNGKVLTRVESVNHGDFLQAGQTRFQFLLHPAGTNTANQVAPLPQDATVVGKASGEAELQDGTSFMISGSMVIGREKGRVQIHLDHPQVSRIHANIVFQGAAAVLTDLNSANGTFVNGQRIWTAVTLRPGDHLDIGPYALQFTGTHLIPRLRSDNVELVANGVGRVVTNRDTGKPLSLLQEITLVVRPHEFVCLLGPSGSGKSTLLKILSGRDRADAGGVLLNSRDLHGNFEALKQDIAVVPQKDVLHESLGVGEALWYTAKLRLPPDTSPSEIETSLGEMLQTVGLTERRSTKIRHLSGGQVKRASLANEILCKPSLLFLDEVTSGLDEQTDREVMNLFRGLADAGKTVVCITHSLANVERTCHLVVILTPGGRLAFVGKPSEALTYFGIERLGDVYEKLEPPRATPEQLEQDPDTQKKLAEQSATQWEAAFRKSPLWQRYVGERLPPPTQTQAPTAFSPSAPVGDRFRLFFRQMVLLTSRYSSIWRGDYPSLFAMVGQALVVALLLGLLFGDLSELENPAEHAQRSVNLMFLLAVSSFWFGCNNAAKEIVKERTIYTRERDFNLLVNSYYASKLLLLTLFSWGQTLLLFAIVHSWCDPPGSFSSELAVLFSLALAGVTLGLAISSFAVTEEMAITLIPMAIIPQIILSGVIAPLEGVSKTLALLGVSTYWGKRGLDACLPEKVAEAMPPTGLEQHSTSTAILVLLVHSLMGMGVALGVLHWQNRRRKTGAS